jgi:LmbE family N-acetylglucosaminyl deacetylase
MAGEKGVNIICIGEHPDDCGIGFGGTAHKFVRLGHAVKLVSVTNGSAGHYASSRSELAMKNENLGLSCN